MEPITSEDLVVEALVKEKIEIANWYASDGHEFLRATDNGRLAFTWEATYLDGTKLRQYDDITFFRAVRDDAFIPGIERIVSTDKIDREKVVEFVLLPTAYTLSKCPRIGRSFRVVVNSKKGEHLIAHWCTDLNTTTGVTLRRHVIGIQKGENKVLFIISPSGSMSMATNDDISFEGE